MENKRFSTVQLIQPLNQQILSRLYGVGISQAQIQEFNNRGLNVEYDIPKDNPDVTDKGRWSGTMSSSLSESPVMCYLKFIGGTYTDLEGTSTDFPDITFETVVVTASLSKNIVKTNISGRNGSVKESINRNDWDIEIRAIITADAPVNSTIEKRNQNGVFPRTNMSYIWELIQSEIAIPVDCWYLQLFDINNLVIEDFTTQQIEGEYSVQRIVIKCCSDKPLVIKIA